MNMFSRYAGKEFFQSGLWGILSVPVTGALFLAVALITKTIMEMWP